MHDERRDEATAAFISRWQDADGRERANYQLFLTELAALLAVPLPEPAIADDAQNAYVFERRVGFRHGDGSQSWGYIDLYRRGAFVLEAKDVRETSDERYTQGMLRARSQAENYARALPAAEGRPPFVVVVDVGRSIELYSEFSRSGATYTPFPDPRSHRIALDDLREEAIRERLRAVWLEPLSLDPARRSAIVTREVAAHLAELARSLEADGHTPQTAAAFLSRCLFTMFAEDVGLIPHTAFRSLLQSLREQPAQLLPMLGDLWRAMDSGTFSVAIRADLLRFNGKLFKEPEVLPLSTAQIDGLIDAARADWREVEPAIFGTLLERALDPEERHALGAHYTPRAYVERLVLPTVIEPLREDWKTAQAAALTLAAEGDVEAALETIIAFHHELCTVRVLDPACGSANFLYVTLEHMKRLEGEVLNAFDELDPEGQFARLRQGSLALDGERADPFGGETVDPHQFLGIEINPRAAAIAELVLWIGYLQWHLRTRPDATPAEPVLRDFRNIECRDAVLAWDHMEYAIGEDGRPITRWDGKTMKPSPVTGELIPDETAQVPLERYLNPRKATWPQADFVVGNPPFIGNKRMRLALGDGYVEALRGAWPEVPDSADLVMYWWQHGAALTQSGALRRFGLITTNSIRQTFNRRVVEPFLTDKKQPLSLTFAIPDHPWVDSADGAAVRIAMTVATHGSHEGRALELLSEGATSEGEVACEFRARQGQVHSDLRAGLALVSAASLQAALGLAFTGMYPLGQGFIVLPDDVASASGSDKNVNVVLKPFVTARDLTQKSRRAKAIDFYPRRLEEARKEFPSLFQWVLDRVKPERDQNPVEERRRNWWLFTRPVPPLRKAVSSLDRYIVVPRTAKWFSFQFTQSITIPDTSVVAIASADAFHLGILSSTAHLVWALAAGGTLEDRPRYQHQRTFNPFPFPDASEAQQARIRELGERIDAHRKRQQAAHEKLTLTNTYNVLEKLRAGGPLNDKERVVHEQGLVSVLRQLHDELDLAVLEAYGWEDLAPLLAIAHAIDPALLPDLGSLPEGTTSEPSVQDIAAARRADNSEATADTKPLATETASATATRSDSTMSREDAARGFEEAVLERLVALNTERAAEERRGLVRWLRPAFQNPEGATGTTAIDLGEVAATPKAAKATKRAWPKALPDQVRAVAEVIAAAPEPLDEDAIAAHFRSRGRWRERLPTILDTLAAIGRIRDDDKRYTAS